MPVWLVSLALVLLSGTASANTGAFCAGNRVVEWVAGQRPGGGWTSVGGESYHRDTGRACDAALATNPVFDASVYLELNPDVRAAGVDPLQHWLAYGREECRASSRSFRVADYLARNRDVADAYQGSCLLALDHYARHGLFEGRETTAEPPLGWLIGAVGMPDRHNIVVHRLGSALTDLHTGLDTSRVTGLPNTRRGLRGPPQRLSGGLGFTGAQIHGGEFGIGIDSRTVKALRPVSLDRLYPVVLEYSPSGYWQPWPGRGLKTSLDLKIPFAGGLDGGGSQVVTYYYVHERTSEGKRAFYLGALLFDTRSNSMDDVSVVPDYCPTGCTGMPILVVPLKRGTPFFDLSPTSSEAQTRTHAETRRYEFDVTQANIQAAIDHIRVGRPEYSPSSKDYEVTSWNLNPEVFAHPTEDGWIGLSGRVLWAGPSK